MMRQLAARTMLTVVPDGVPVLRGVVRNALTSVFGPPPLDPTQDVGDPGLFGPGSGSWHVLGHPAGIAGGFRALLVQLMHPLAMAGVADHSEFEDDALGRLRNTAAYVTITAFGSTREAFDVARKVRHAHSFVRGTAPDGRPYSADDPELLAWVSIALTSSFLATDAAYAADPATGETADVFVAEQSRAAALLDPRVDPDAIEANPEAVGALKRGELDLPMLSEGLLPTTIAELDEVFERYRPELTVNEQGERALKFLKWPPVPPAVRAGYMPLLAAALATIPPELRQLLRVPTIGPVDAAIRAQSWTLFTGLRVTSGIPLSIAYARRRLDGAAA